MILLPTGPQALADLLTCVYLFAGLLLQKQSLAPVSTQASSWFRLWNCVIGGGAAMTSLMGWSLARFSGPGFPAQDWSGGYF